MKNKRQSDKHFKAQWKSTILKKKVNLSNICNLIKYFIENDSVTGQIISVDSGQSLEPVPPAKIIGIILYIIYIVLINFYRMAI